MFSRILKLRIYEFFPKIFFALFFYKVKDFNWDQNIQKVQIELLFYPKKTILSL